MKTPPNFINRAIIEAERADYFAQRSKAQEEIGMYQQALNGANQRFLLADGAAQACQAILDKDTKDETSDSTPKP